MKKYFQAPWNTKDIIITIITASGLLGIAFFGMRYFGIDANVMSLGGIAIAIGVMVDSGCIIVENIYRRLAEAASLDAWRDARPPAHPVVSRQTPYEEFDHDLVE